MSRDFFSATRDEQSSVYWSPSLESDVARPRAVLVDLDGSSLDEVLAHPQRMLASDFREENLIRGEFGTGSNFGMAHYNEGAILVRDVVEAVRAESELCDRLEGLQFCFSIGGGTGSGLGTLAISRLLEEFSDKMVSVFCVLPSTKLSSSVIEPYNAVLALHQLIENASLVFCLDNEALFDRACLDNASETATLDQTNELITQAMKGVTAPLRTAKCASNSANNTLRKQSLNLVPYPRLKFLSLAIAPPRSLSFVGECCYQLFDRRNFFVAGAEQTKSNTID